jgi:hypothetical protein
VRRDVNGTPASYFLWDGEQLFAELDGGQYLVAQYSYYPGLDQLHAFNRSGSVSYAQQDVEGNVRYLGTNTYNQTRSYTYDESGNLVGGTDWGHIVGRDGRQRYNQGGIHAGWDVSAQLVVGFVTSPEVITGRSREVCVGVFIFSGCYSRSGDEWGLSFGVGPSPLSPVTVHSGYTWGRLF